ncbi:hypothetical protein LCGC14_1373590 [marine sediment metagenome]|uniref:Uncharacterized protein n=1 Tax=marine sediment metagenome TaxID=412755 RepID=A0A0F9MJZ7_9ZZZZ
MAEERKVDIFIRFRHNIKQFANIMKLPMDSFRKIHDNTGRLNQSMAKNQTRMGKFAFGLRRATHGMRGFKMEMLGVMFFGMGLQKFFTGLLKPALQLSGLFEIWSTTLSILFLPVALMLLDLLLPLFLWMMNLSEATKLVIGKMVLWGAIIGGALFLFGMFALGIGSLILAFGGLLGIIERLFPEPLGDFAAAFVGINVAMLGISAGVSIWKALKGVISGVWEKLMEIPVFKKLLEKLGLSVEDMKTPWDAIKTKIKEVFDDLKKRLGIDEDVGEFTKKISTLKDEFKKIWDNIKDIDFSKMAESMQELTEQLLSFLPELAELVTLALKLAAVPGRILSFLGVGEPSLAQEYGSKRVLEETDMRTQIADGVEEGMDRVLFKRPGTFLDLVTDPYERTLRQTGGEE